MNYSLVFPDQLFHKNPSILRGRKVLILKHPYFFSRFRYNKKKILMHLMSIEYYKRSLESDSFEVEIIELKDFQSLFLSGISQNHLIHTCEISNLELSSFLNELSSKNIQVKYYKSPMFYESVEDLKKYFGDKKKYIQLGFYKKLRIKHQILLSENKSPLGGKWSFDSQNRKKIPEKKLPSEKITFSYDKEILNYSKSIISNLYVHNYGNLMNFNFPVNRTQALDNLDFFLEKKFENFGIYQDAIFSSETLLYHSNLSSSLNIGLLTPKEVIEKAIEFCNHKNIPINSLEGFIRQILGWREFIRGIYLNKFKYQYSSNFWDSQNKFPDLFYESKTGILPLDDSLNKSINDSYAHHIERLMIQGNLMLLLEITPKEVYKWFMEIFIDSSDWVMGPNVFGMSLYSDGGLMSSKPYISSSNYILGMSNYKKEKWSSIWDALFWSFIHKHKEKIKGINRMAFMLNLLDKKSREDIYNFEKTSDNFKNSLF
ncbi:MAG: cryptochrome/photolyase family protein [Chloroflexi bacterium]|nr:cryptochrome/photolyase family protein [Chloroflexota bacterium]